MFIHREKEFMEIKTELEKTSGKSSCMEKEELAKQPC